VLYPCCDFFEFEIAGKDVNASLRSAVHLILIVSKAFFIGSDLQRVTNDLNFERWIQPVPTIGMSFALQATIQATRFAHILPISSTIHTMKFSNAALALFVLATPATAWTSQSTSVRGFTSRTTAAVQLHASIGVEQSGEAATESFRLNFKEGDKPISAWHDIALKNADGSYNMVSFRYV
jgi:hypothetical protein